MLKFLLALIALLLFELALLVWLTQQIGWWITVAIMFVGGLAGTGLAKRQSRRVFRDWQTALRSGQPPAAGALDAMLVLASGALFLLPGLLSDVLGLLLLWAPVRASVARYLRRFFDVKASQKGFGIHRNASRRGDDSSVVDTQGEALEESDAPPQLQTGGEDASATPRSRGR
jgi:UPF0716 family protein affecting phage T7 exclusion